MSTDGDRRWLAHPTDLAGRKVGGVWCSVWDAPKVRPVTVRSIR